MLTGADSNMMAGIHFEYKGGDDAHYSVDRFLPKASNLLFASEDDTARTVSKETDMYRVVASSSILGAMADGDTLDLKPYYVSEIIDYFLNLFTVSTNEYAKSDDPFSATAFPNPFKRKANIDYYLEKSGHVSVEIINSSGQIIKVLANEFQQKGRHVLNWESKKENGSGAEEGLYFYRIRQNENTISGKIILL